LIRISWDIRGLGAARPVVPNPTSEEGRRRNRRVEIAVNGEGLEPTALVYIRWMQSCLNRISRADLALTGSVSPKMRGAIRSFQQRQGQPPSGVITPETATALGNTCVGASPPDPGKKGRALYLLLLGRPRRGC
jgi:hypothetical protein